MPTESPLGPQTDLELADPQPRARSLARVGDAYLDVLAARQRVRAEWDRHTDESVFDVLGRADR